MNKINDNKFRNFLHRIFKKKYKESKREDGNENTLKGIIITEHCLNFKKVSYLKDYLSYFRDYYDND